MTWEGILSLIPARCLSYACSASSQSSLARSASPSSGELNRRYSSGVKNFIAPSEGFSVWGLIEGVPLWWPRVGLAVRQRVGAQVSVRGGEDPTSVRVLLYRLGEGAVRRQMGPAHDHVPASPSQFLRLGLGDCRPL